MQETNFEYMGYHTWPSNVNFTLKSSPLIADLHHSCLVTRDFNRPILIFQYYWYKDFSVHRNAKLVFSEIALVDQIRKHLHNTSDQFKRRRLN